MSVMSVDIANVVGTSTDADGFQSTQWDAEGEGQAGVAAAPSLHPFGSWGRAPDGVAEPGTQGGAGSGNVDPSRSAQVMVLHEGSHAHTVDLQHVPTVGLIPIIAAGEHINYSSAGNFTRHFVDGSICRATTDAGGGNSGTAITDWLKATGWTHDAPWGRLVFDPTGFRVKTAGGAKLSLGFLGGLPAPFNGGMSYARLQAQSIELSGGAVHIGPPASDLEPVAKAPQLYSVLTSMMTAIQALLSAMATITATSPGAAAAGIITPIVQQAQAAVSAALPLISTQTAIG